MRSIFPLLVTLSLFAAAAAAAAAATATVTAVERSVPVLAKTAPGSAIIDHHDRDDHHDNKLNDNLMDVHSGVDLCSLFLQSFEKLGSSEVNFIDWCVFPFTLLDVKVDAHRNSSSGEVTFTIAFNRSQQDSEMFHQGPGGKASEADLTKIKADLSVTPQTILYGSCLNNSIQVSPGLCPSNAWVEADFTVDIANCSCNQGSGTTTRSGAPRGGPGYKNKLIQNKLNDFTDSDTKKITSSGNGNGNINGNETCMAFDFTCSAPVSGNICGDFIDSNCDNTEVVISLACTDGAYPFQGVLRAKRSKAVVRGVVE